MHFLLDFAPYEYFMEIIVLEHRSGGIAYGTFGVSANKVSISSEYLTRGSTLYTAGA